MVIQLGVTGLITGFVSFLDLFGRTGGERLLGWYDLLCVECFMAVVLMS